MIWLALAARAAPVECDGLAAASLLADARIAENRAPVSHPELIPGLALSSSRTEADLRAALVELCAGGEAISLTQGETYEAAGWSAHTFLLSRSETVGCTLFQRTIAISVGVAADTLPRYRLRARLPLTRTPVGDCETTPTWREETVLGGEGGPVRLVLATDLDDDVVAHSEVLVRRASVDGWTEQVLAAPAPERLLTGGDGPVYTLTERDDDKWVVAHADRRGMPDRCTAVPGQTVWTWDDGWQAHGGRAALVLLATRGLWRLAGDPGWMPLLAQDDEEDAELLAVQVPRIQRRWTEPLLTLPSAWFPGLNPGFLVVTPGPYPDEAQARAAVAQHRGLRRSYVKKAWEPPDPCAP